MNIVTPLARMRFVGKLCRLGAWIILALGIAAIILFYLLSTNALNGPGNGPGGGPSLNDLFTTLVFIFLMAILVSFFSLILYAAGTLLSYLSREKEILQESDEPVTVMSLTEI